MIYLIIKTDRIDRKHREKIRQNGETMLTEREERIVSELYCERVTCTCTVLAGWSSSKGRSFLQISTFSTIR